MRITHPSARENLPTVTGTHGAGDDDVSVHLTWSRHTGAAFSIYAPGGVSPAARRVLLDLVTARLELAVAAGTR